MKIVCAAEFVEVGKGYCNLCASEQVIQYSVYVESSVSHKLMKLHLCEKCRKAKVFDF